MISPHQIQQFLESGAVTIDTPLSPQQIIAASAAFDRLLPFQDPPAGEKPQYRRGQTCSFYDPELLEILQHPFFEEVAGKILRTDQARFFQSAVVTAYPEPNTPFRFDQHIDIEYSLSDFQATPGRIICSFFLWITDVNERRAPMMYRPGSHLLLAAAREQDPERNGAPPRVVGIPLAQLPALDYADPIPLLARAGQVSVLTTGMVHGGSVNVDREPRKDMVITFTAAGVKIDLDPYQAAQKREYDLQLRRRLRPDRAHILAV